MKPIKNVLVAWLLLSASLMWGQSLSTVISPQTITAPVNSIVDLQIKVTNFTNVISFQCPITYNAAVLEYLSADGIGLPGMASGDIGNPLLPTPRVTLSWFANATTYPNGLTLPAGTSILTLHFKVKANGTAMVNLAGGGLQPALEVINSQGNELTVNYQSGGSTVTGGSGGGGGGMPLTGFHIIAPTDTVAPGETFCVPITVNDFDNILALTYAISWNTSILQFVGTQGYNLPGVDPTNVNTIIAVNPATGALVTAWIDPNLAGVSLPDGATIYEVCFKALGPVGSSSVINIGATGLPPTVGSPEAVNAAGNNIWVSGANATGVSGTVYIQNPAGPKVTFAVDTLPAQTGTSVCLQVKVKNFTEVQSLQLAFTFDQTKLTFQNANPVGTNPLNLSPGLSGVVNTPTPGQIRVTWTDPTAQGVTVADNTAIFNLCFLATGAAGMTVPVQVVGVPNFDLEVVQDANGNSVETVPQVQHGYVRITAIPPPPTCNVSVTVDNTVQVKCNNGSDGAINITPNGTGNYTYTWSGPGFSSTAQDVSGLKAGTYNVTVTSTVTGSSCSTTANYTIIQPQALALPTVTPTPLNCFGVPTGSISISATGGTGNLTYLWSGPSSFTSNQQNINNLATGNYTVTVTDANNCTLVSGQILVPSPTAVVIPTASINVVSNRCFGLLQGSINLSASGGTGPYTYTWSGPNLNNVAQAPPLNNLAAGFYTVTVADSKGCTLVSSPIKVEQPGSAVTIALDTKENIKCFGDENGKANLIMLGGTPPYTTVWRNSATNAIVNPLSLPSGTYFPVVTDQNNCSATLPPVIIEGPTAPLTGTYGNSQNITCFGVNTGSITLNVSGGWGGSTVNWSPGGTGTTLTGLPAGTYTPTITDNGGCSVVLAGKQITGPTQAAFISNTVVNNVKCFGEGNGSIAIVVSGGTGPNYQVNWSNTNLLGLQISNLAPGSYTPMITDANGCTSTSAPITVTSPSAPLDVDEVIVNQSGTVNGSITLTPSGGTATYSYQWDPPTSSNNIISGPAGNYAVTVTDANGCKYFGNYVIEQNIVPIPTPELLPVTPDCGDAGGCIRIFIPPSTAPGLKPYAYKWSPAVGGNDFLLSFSDTTEICDLPANVYNITITAANGSSTTLAAPISLLPPVVISAESENPNEDFGNGSIELEPAIPGSSYSYAWNYQGLTTSSITNLDSGLYVVTITDNVTGCTTIWSKHLERVWQPMTNNNPDIKRPSCVSSTDGTIRLFIGGGGMPYSYKWAGPGASYPDTSRLTNLGAGFYAVTVTDRNGTTLTATYTLTPLSNIQATATVTPGPNGWDVSGADECDGHVKAAATGHVPPLTYSWNNGFTGANNQTLCVGDWWAIVTDGAGCADTLTGSLTAPPVLGSAVTVSDYNGFGVKCTGDCNGEAVVSANGGQAPYTVKWSTGFQQTLATASEVSQRTGLCAGTYTVTITDANGISAEKPIEVTEPDSMVIDFTARPPERFTVCDGEVVASTNGAEPIKWNWASDHANGNTPRADDVCAGEKFQFIAVDAFGCRATADFKMPYPQDGCLVFRPVLTPGQSEGENDYLLITCIESVPDNNLEIYNRWGQLVFQTKAYDNETNHWRGTNSKNQPLPEGVYFYILTYTDGRGDLQQLKGYVNLIR